MDTHELQGARVVKPKAVNTTALLASWQRELARVGSDPAAYLAGSELSLPAWFDNWAGILERAGLERPPRPGWVGSTVAPATHATPPAAEQGSQGEEPDGGYAEALEWITKLEVLTHPFLVSVQEQAQRTGRLSTKQAAAVLRFKANWKPPTPQDLGSTKAAAPKAQPATESALEAGIYTPDEGTTVYKVQVAVHGSGMLYAKRLTPQPGGQTAKFEYEKGAIRRLTPDMHMSLEQAKAFGAIYGVCCVCGRTLTDEDSIEAGIGPVCAGREWGGR